MKKILIILVLFVISSNMYAQIEIDMAGESIKDDTKNGTYYMKDVNDYLLPYTGTWKYIDGNKEFRITLTKVIKYHVLIQDYNIDYYKDGLIIQYEKYENGILIYNSLQSTHPAAAIKEFGNLRMSFKDYGRNGCMFPVDLMLIPIGNNQYNLKFKIDRFEARNTYFQQHPNEPYFSVPNDIIMTKL